MRPMSEESPPVVEFDDDFTPLASVDSEQLILKIGSMLQKQGVAVAMIPSVKDTAEKALEVNTETRETLIALSVKQEILDDRFARVERFGHHCRNQQVIEKHEAEAVEWRHDKEEGIKSREMIQTTAKEVLALRLGSKKLIGAMVTAALGIMLTVVGASWNTGGRIEGINQRLEAEKVLRAEQFSSIKFQLSKIPDSPGPRSVQVQWPTEAQDRGVCKNCATNHRFGEDQLAFP